MKDTKFRLGETVAVVATKPQPCRTPSSPMTLAAGHGVGGGSAYSALDRGQCKACRRCPRAQQKPTAPPSPPPPTPAGTSQRVGDPLLPSPPFSATMQAPTNSTPPQLLPLPTTMCEGTLDQTRPARLAICAGAVGCPCPAPGTHPTTVPAAAAARRRRGKACGAQQAAARRQAQRFRMVLASERCAS